MKKILKVVIVLILAIFMISFFKEVVVEEIAFKETTITKKAVDEECTSVIVTGTHAKGGRSILMKNRDWQDTQYQKPTFYSSYESGPYSFVWGNMMGMNEAGLATMNTLQSSGLNNWQYNIGGTYDKTEGMMYILSHFSDPEQAVAWLINNVNASEDCIGVIGQNSSIGAFVWIDKNHKAITWVNNSHNAAANNWVPDGVYGSRGQRAKSILDNIYAEKGVISWQDVSQQIAKDQGDQEQTNNNCYSYSGNVCNSNTLANMVAVSGNRSYSGRLNAMWLNYGENAQIGLFLPIMPGIVESPSDTPTVFTSGNGLGGLVETKRNFARDGCSAAQWNGTRVREIHKYSFYAENYTFDKYDELMKNIPAGLTDAQLKSYLKNYVDDAIQFATNVYIAESVSPTTTSSTTTTTVPTTTTMPIANPVAYWKFDEGSGTVALDSSGNANTGSISGATFSKGKIGYALSFDGIDDRVNVTDSNSLDLTDVFTLEAWVYPKAWGEGGNGRIICKNFYRTYSLYVRSASAGTALGIGGSGYYPVSNTINLNNWYHVAVTFDKSLPSDQIKFYVNGSLVGASARTSSVPITTENLYIGNNNDTDRTFSGLIDEVRIYKRALSSTEIYQHYQDGLVTSTTTTTTIPTTTSTSTTTTTVPTTTSSTTTTIPPAQNFVLNPSFEGATWQYDANNYNFADWDIGRNNGNGLVQTWIETANTHSGAKALHWKTTVASSPTTISLSYSTNASKRIQIDENKYIEAGVWRNSVNSTMGDDISLIFYFPNGSSLRLWGQDKLGSFLTNNWARISLMWYPSSMGEGKGYIPKGAISARLVIYCNYQVAGIREGIEDDVFIKQYDHVPDWAERLDKNFNNLKLESNFNIRTGESKLSYGVHESDSHNFYLAKSNPTLLSKMKEFNFSYIRFQYKYYESCNNWNSTTHACGQYDWTKLDSLLDSIKAIGAEPIVCIGGGNIENVPTKYWLPTGMTANYSGTSYPSDADFGNYAYDIVKHMNMDKKYNVKYWEVWNEPAACKNVNEFVNLFNNAAKRMHDADSTVKISNDRINVNPMADALLSSAQGVGFLSFHYYASGGTCMNPFNTSNINNVYYPPNDQNNWLKDETIMLKTKILGNNCPDCWCTYSPDVLVAKWKQKTGQELEYIGTEINMNAAWENGTDNRMQDPLGAAWFASKVRAYILNDATTGLVYFNLMSTSESKPMSQYGGWGFGMMSSVSPYTNYAPAWAMDMLTKYVPKGSILYDSKSSDTDVLEILPVKAGGKNNILLINKFNRPTTASLSIIGMTAKNLTLYLLDNSTFIRRYEPSLGKTVLYKSEISSLPLPKDNVQHLSFNGYTVAILEISPDESAPYVSSIASGTNLNSAKWEQNKYSMSLECSGINTIQIHSETKPPFVKIGGNVVTYDESLGLTPSWKYDAANKVITIKFSC